MVRISLSITALALLFCGPARAQDPKKKDPQPIDGLKALKDPDPKVRYNAADLLARLGPVGKFAVADLKAHTIDDRQRAEALADRVDDDLLIGLLSGHSATSQSSAVRAGAWRHQA